MKKQVRWRAQRQAFKQNNVQKVILDLRSSPGGTVTAAQALAGLWLDNQDIMTERRGDKVVKTVKSTGKPLLQDIKTVVLIDRSSASASEIVAGALQKNTARQNCSERRVTVRVVCSN